MYINSNNYRIDSMVAGLTLIDYQQLPWYSTLLELNKTPIYCLSNTSADIQVKVPSLSATRISGFIPVDSLTALDASLSVDTHTHNLAVHIYTSFKQIADFYLGGIGAIFSVRNKSYAYSLAIISATPFTSEDLDCLSAGLSIAKTLALGYKQIDICAASDNVKEMTNTNHDHTPMKDFSRSIFKVSKMNNVKVNIINSKTCSHEHYEAAKLQAVACLNTALDYVNNNELKVIDNAAIDNIPKALVNKTLLEYKELYEGRSHLKAIKKFKSYTNPPNTTKLIGCQAATIAELLDTDPDTLNELMDGFSFCLSAGVNKRTNQKLLKLIKTGESVKLNENQIQSLATTLCYGMNPPDRFISKTGVLVLAVVHVLELDIKSSLLKISQYDLSQLANNGKVPAFN